VYIWRGSKQNPDIYSWWCIEKVYDGPQSLFSLYQMKF
jgi:hypothetical protein